MANFDPALLRPGARGDREPQRHAGARLRRPLQRHGPRGRGRARRTSCSACPNGNSPAVLAVPAGAPRGFYPNRHLFAPRFSFAWTPTGSSEMAVRGGVGLFYDRPEGNLLFGGGGNGPRQQPALRRAARSTRTATSPPPAAAPCPRRRRSGNIAAIDPDLQVPRSWNWSLSVQRELPWGLFGEIGLRRQPRARTCSASPTSTSPRSRMLGGQRRAARRPARQHELPAALQGLLGDLPVRLGRPSSSYHALQLFLSKRRGSLRWTRELHAQPLATTRAATTTARRRLLRLSSTSTATGGRATSTARTSWSAPGPGSSRSSRSRRASGACWAAGRSAASAATSRARR